MARVVAFVPDLLFGSNVIGALQAGGHDPVVVSALDQPDTGIQTRIAPSVRLPQKA